MTISPLANAILERMLRGGIAALVAVYLSGNLVFDTTHVSGSLAHVVTIFIGGAVSALAISLGVHAATKSGPALNRNENLTAPQPRGAVPPGEAGQMNLDLALLLLILTFVGVVLLLFRVHFGG